MMAHTFSLKMLAWGDIFDPEIRKQDWLRPVSVTAQDY
jgi:hypothetical protein